MVLSLAESASIKDHTQTIGSGAIVGRIRVTGDIAAGKTMLGYLAVEARGCLEAMGYFKRLSVNESKK
jgi:UDP-3-O-[3-hydroxymyristoyl] glucosamine N-acyltransferase